MIKTIIDKLADWIAIKLTKTADKKKRGDMKDNSSGVVLVVSVICFGLAWPAALLTGDIRYICGGVLIFMSGVVVSFFSLMFVATSDFKEPAKFPTNRAKVVVTLVPGLVVAFAVLTTVGFTDLLRDMYISSQFLCILAIVVAIFALAEVFFWRDDKMPTRYDRSNYGEHYKILFTAGRKLLHLAEAMMVIAAIGVCQLVSKGAPIVANYLTNTVWPCVSSFMSEWGMQILLVVIVSIAVILAVALWIILNSLKYRKVGVGKQGKRKQ